MIKYAIIATCYGWDGENGCEKDEELYVAVEGEYKILIFEDSITNKTKLFSTAKEAGEYVDKHFGANDQRASYRTVKTVEVTTEY